MNKTVNQLLKKHGNLLIHEVAQKFEGKNFTFLFRRGVYLMLKGHEVLYVGMTAYQLIKRAVNSCPRALDHADALHLYPCVSTKAARTLEKILIRELQPRYNTQLKT